MGYNFKDIKEALYNESRKVPGIHSVVCSKIQ